MREFDFYVVPTPIGNLGDITLRAIETLKNVDIIACEDTRITQKLLNRYEIKTKCISYHKFNERQRLEQFLEILKEGKKIALVSDAGTPLICDPGSILVDELRHNGIKITALPGASALTTFLSQVTRCAEDFVFVGFLPKSDPTKIFEKYRSTDLVFYESPNRLLKTLSILGDRQVAVGRELTKVFEQIKIGTARELTFEVLKGEVAVLVFRDQDHTPLDEKIAALQKKGFSAKDISVIISQLYGVNKNDIYKKILQ
jgi:16S rRNA (cytidine1402-2'-O)-methyltransferase